MENPFEKLESRLERIESLVSRIVESGKREDHSNAKKVGNIGMAKEITGLSKSTIYRLASERRIPHAKSWGKLYFNATDLLDWISKCRREEKNSSINKGKK